MANQVKQSAAHLLAQHARVIDGDRDTLEQLAGDLWPHLCRRLRRLFRHAPSDLVADASNDAILMYSARPQAFDINRGVPLDHFMLGIAARILRGRLRSDKRRLQRENVFAERLQQAYGHQTERVTLSAAVQEVRRALPLVCDATELAAIAAWLNEDDTGVVAVHLGLGSLRPTEQRREVRRFTTRVIKRLRRHFGAGKHPPACG